VNTDRQARRSDLAWIGLAFLAFIFVGFGLRDPWPADEPRFAAVALDMLRSGDWLIPRVGGDLYQDKPPLHLWLIAASLQLTGELRSAFLLPSMMASLGTLLLVYDLGRRLHGREAGLAAALTLACCVQFVQVTRGAQIRPGAVSTQCGVYRAAPAFQREWAYLYGGDGVFLAREDDFLSVLRDVVRLVHHGELLQFFPLVF
jgi:4-amino-4-deoxy-L-arabinose transferase-like glycosyltransferase